MEINIDFLVAGCNTRCKHCYVNGSPGPMMPVDDALLCIERLDEMAKYLPKGTSFTLDHEPMNHPQLDQILSAASRTKNITNYHHGMTTGIGLMHRKDKDAVVQAYFDNGYHTFGITIHGFAPHHDEIVRRKGAYDAAVSTVHYLKEQGAKVEISLMLNNYFTEDATEISAMLEHLNPDYIGFAIPIFTPHANMMDFEPYRVTLDTIEALRGHMSDWKQNEHNIMEAAKQNTVAAAITRLNQGINLQERFGQKQNELYLTLHPDCKLYVGNTGAETLCLGNLKMLNMEETTAIINELPGNRDYTAYYDLTVLPTTGTLIATLEKLSPNAVYGDFESVLYRGLVEQNIPTRML